MHKESYRTFETNGFRHLAEGTENETSPVVMLHGMLGDPGNWSPTVAHLARNGYRAVVPVLPVYELPLRHTSVEGLADYVHEFLLALDAGPVTLVGNSLGGHVALLCALNHPELMAGLVLAGSSGIYEVEPGTSTPRRHDREFVRERAALTFHDPAHVTDELVDELLAIISDRARVARLIKMARSTRNQTVTTRLHEIEVPTLLVWGRNDLITPPEVAEEFRDRIPNAELVFIDACGHAPMIERPDEFNRIMLAFLRKRIGTGTLAL